MNNNNNDQLLIEETKIILQVQRDIIQGADVNTKIDNWFPLHIAISNGNTEQVELLLSYGADINARIKCYGHSMKLLCSGLQLRAFINSWNLHISDSVTLSSLEFAYKFSNYNPRLIKVLENYKELIEQAKSSDPILQRQAFIKALEFGYINLFTQLLNRGVIPTKENLEIVKHKYAKEQQQWRKNNYIILGRLLLQYLRIIGELQAPEMLPQVNNIQQVYNIQSDAYAPISKFGIMPFGLPKYIAHIIALRILDK